MTALMDANHQLMKDLRKTGKCMVHGHHQPASYTHAFHHIIPREWQWKWTPDTGDLRLRQVRIWAPDSIITCPTGHTNIHYHIREIIKCITIMKYNMGIPGTADWLGEEILAVVKTYRPRGANQKELKVARQAFINWEAALGRWSTILKELK